MAKYYRSTTHSPLLFQASKNSLSKIDLCRALNCSKPTLDAYIENPGLIRLLDIHILAGLFGLHTEELTHLLIRNKSNIKTLGDSSKWFLEDIRTRNKEE